jgi:hypothetical protein
LGDRRPPLGSERRNERRGARFKGRACCGGNGVCPHGVLRWMGHALS